MATKLGSRAGAAHIGTLMMLGSFVLVAGFMYWLSVTAKPTEIIPVEKRRELIENVVTLANFSNSPDDYVGELVGIRNVRMGSAFGNHGRWINLEDASRNGYIVHFSDSVRADTTSFYPSIAEGVVVNLSGVVVATTDSVLDAWETGGGFASEVDKLLAEATPYLNFIEVTVVEQARAPQGTDASGASN